MQVSEAMSGDVQIANPKQSICDAARMMADLQKLAGWVKLSGTQEELESLSFVRSRYEAAGFRTRIIRHDAYISLPGPARIEHDGRTLRAITHSMAVPSPREGLKRRLVYAGAGACCWRSKTAFRPAAWACTSGRALPPR